MKSVEILSPEIALNCEGFVNSHYIVHIGESVEALKERFTNCRDHLPHMVVMTPYDVDGTLWTKNQPSPQVRICVRYSVPESKS